MSQLTNSYPLPVLEEDRYDYLNDSFYEVEQIDGDKNSEYIVLKHKIHGENLVSYLLKNNEAKFITTIVLKSSMYRETLSNVEEITSSEVHQKIPLKTTFETQNFFSSVVYIGEDRELTLIAKEMDLDEFWDGIKIKLLKGTILARDGWRELENSASDLLSVKKDENIKYGFDVDIDPAEGGRFIAKMEPKLFESISQMSSTSDHRRSIMIHVLCVGFMSLYRDYKEDDSELSNFKAIKLDLKTKGIKTWEDDEFNPNQVACYFLEHKIIPQGDSDD